MELDEIKLGWNRLEGLNEWATWPFFLGGSDAVCQDHCTYKN